MEKIVEGLLGLLGGLGSLPFGKQLIVFNAYFGIKRGTDRSRFIKA